MCPFAPAEWVGSHTGLVDRGLPPPDRYLAVILGRDTPGWIQMRRPFGNRSGKFNAQMVEVEGRKFHSKREARKYVQLLALQRAGVIRDLECQVPLTVFLNGIRITCFKLDFRYTLVRDGRVIHLEVKGFKTEVYKLKRKLIEAHFGIAILED